MLPRYSIRTMFYLAIGVVMLAIVIGQGFQGELWALAVTVGAASLLLTWLVLLLFYAMVAAYARVAIPPSQRVGAKAYYPASSATVPPLTVPEMPPSSPPGKTE